MLSYVGKMYNLFLELPTWVCYSCHSSLIFSFPLRLFDFSVSSFWFLFVSFGFGLCCRHHGTTASDVIGLALQSYEKDATTAQLAQLEPEADASQGARHGVRLKVTITPNCSVDPCKIFIWPRSLHIGTLNQMWTWDYSLHRRTRPFLK